VKSPSYTANLEPKDRLESSLHDITNALSAAQSFSEVLLLRIKAGNLKDPTLVENIIRELERANDIVKKVRAETYKAGDVLQCTKCGYNFINRRASGKRPSCRRCNSTDLERWKPSTTG